MAIALGVTWFEALDARQDIIDLVDFIEVPGWLLTPAFVRPHERIVLHNLDQDWSMASPDAIDAGWPERLRNAIAVTRTPWFSMHLGFACEEVRFENHMHPESPPLDRALLLDRIVRTTNAARRDCPLQLLLENLDYCPEGAYEHICEPEFISEVLELTGAGMLFDLAHWRVSASWLGFDPVEALEMLPLDRAVEVHLSSPRPLDDGMGRLEDVHEILTPADLGLFSAVLRRSSPQAVTIEYARDPDALKDQLQSVRDILGPA